MADGDIDAQVAQPLYVCAFGDIAALNRVAEIVQDFSNSAHADAADTDEMNRADAEGERLHAAISRTELAPGP